MEMVKRWRTSWRKQELQTPRTSWRVRQLQRWKTTNLNGGLIVEPERIIDPSDESKSRKEKGKKSSGCWSRNCVTTFTRANAYSLKWVLKNKWAKVRVQLVVRETKKAKLECSKFLDPAMCFLQLCSATSKEHEGIGQPRDHRTSGPTSTISGVCNVLRVRARLNVCAMFTWDHLLSYISLFFGTVQQDDLRDARSEWCVAEVVGWTSSQQWFWVGCK